MVSFVDMKRFLTTALGQGLTPRDGLDLAGLKTDGGLFRQRNQYMRSILTRSLALEGIAILQATEIWIAVARSSLGDDYDAVRFNVHDVAYPREQFEDVSERFWEELRNRFEIVSE